MKLRTRLLGLIFFGLFLGQSLSSQIVITSDMLNYRNLNVRMALEDKTTKEPIPWASVYLIPDGDTTITHFALSDEQGKVQLKSVPVGRYQVNAEIIGYKPYRKVHKLEGWDMDLGNIGLEPDLEQLEAAIVTATGNPIVLKKDTIEFNASSFRVGENDMLEDLLKKMPGMEVSEDGTVTVNGEAVDKITVGGRTFFFNDPSAALKNLPAKIVDKIKIIDKETKEAEFTGISSGNDKEKVLDVQLKEEYSEGWFGNAKLGLGHDLMQETEDNLIMDPGLLYTGNAMVSGYTEKDQLVFIGNGYNVTDPAAFMIYYGPSGMEEDDYSSMRGIGTAANAGLNYNTQRLKNFETSVSANYKHGTKDARTRSSRTSYQQEGQPLVTDADKEGFGEEDSINATFEIESTEGKDKKWDLYLGGLFRLADNHVDKNQSSQTLQDQLSLNESHSTSRINSRYFTSSLAANTGIKFKKARRNLNLMLSYSLAQGTQDKHEISQLTEVGSSQIQDLLYDKKTNSTDLSARLSYVEPIASKWAIQLLIASRYRQNQEDTRATNPDGSDNAYYSNFSHNRYLSEEARLVLQFRNDTTTLQAGISAQTILNELDSRSLGVESKSGHNEWLMNWSPYVSYSYRNNNHNLYFWYSGSSQQVSNRQSAPTLDLSNRVQIQAGNIYLKPRFEHWSNINYRYNNRETFSFLNTNLTGTSTIRPIVYASWFDANGIRYAIPVNSTDPAYSANLYISYNQPIGKNRKLSVNLDASTSYSNNLSYQAKGQLPGIDINTFDYNSFMATFWGKDGNGEIFYSGESGFQESRTHTLGWSAGVGLKYNLAQLSLSADFSTRNSISRYTLDPTANMNTWNHTLSGDVLYQPGKGWEIETDIRYRMYRGYASGYGDPELEWNARIGKSIGKWTISAQVVDILNQTRSLRRTTSAEYTEDTYSNVMGRYFLINLSLNFGKMNPAKNNAVQNAVFKMM